MTDEPEVRCLNHIASTMNPAARTRVASFAQASKKQRPGELGNDDTTPVQDAANGSPLDVATGSITRVGTKRAASGAAEPEKERTAKHQKPDKPTTAAGAGVDNRPEP